MPQTSSSLRQRTRSKPTAGFHAGDRVISDDDSTVYEVLEVEGTSLKIKSDSMDDGIWVDSDGWQIAPDRPMLASEESIAAAEERFRNSGERIQAMGSDSDKGGAIEVAATVEVVSEGVDRLAELKQSIRSNLHRRDEAERAVWIAVAEIKERELWKLETSEDGSPKYKTFLEFCEGEYGWKTANAYAVAGSGQLIKDLDSRGLDRDLLPTSVDQARKLYKVSPDDRPTVLRRAKEIGGGKITAEVVEKAVESYLGEGDDRRFEDVAALYAEIPHTRFIKHKSGPFNYAVEHSSPLNKTKVYRSLKEAEDNIQYHRDWVTRRLQEIANRNASVDASDSTQSFSGIEEEPIEEESAISTPIGLHASSVTVVDEADATPHTEDFATPAVRDIPGYTAIASAIASFSRANTLRWSEEEARSITHEVIRLLCDRAGLEVA